MNKTTFSLISLIILIVTLTACNVEVSQPIVPKTPVLENAKYIQSQNEKHYFRAGTEYDYVFDVNGQQYVLKGDSKYKDILVKDSVYNVEYHKHEFRIESVDFAIPKQEEEAK